MRGGRGAAIAAFLFAGETPTRTHSIARRALDKLNAAGLVQPLEARSLVRRALDNVAREIIGLS